MLAIRRLTKKFSKQCLNEVKPAPPSETVDHTLQHDVSNTQQSSHPATTSPSHTSPSHTSPSHTSPSHTSSHTSPFHTSPSHTFPSPSSSFSRYSSAAESSESEEEEERSEEEEESVKGHPPHSDLTPVGRVPSAEKRKYSQYKSSTGSSSSASSSDDEVKEAFEGLAGPWPSLAHSRLPYHRPIRVPPPGCRKKVPKYFAQMSSARSVERPRLDFNKMQCSKRFVMVHRPNVLRHHYSRSSTHQRPTLELAMDFSHYSFQPVSAQM